MTRRLRVDDQAAPLAVAGEHPRFSWAHTGAEARIVVWPADDPGNPAWEATDLGDPAVGLDYGGSPLRPGTRYRWRVEAGDERAEAEFRTAPEAFPTVGRWIGAPGGAEFGEPVLRRTIRIDRPVTEAIWYVCGLGLQRPAIDGRPANDHRLSPPFAAFDRTVWYVPSDVTDRLGVGEHELEITLGNGFFAVPTPNVWNWHTPPWLGPLRAVAELELRYADGSRELIGTDESWTVTRGGTTLNCYYAGEAFDATLPPGDPMPAVPLDPPAGELRPQAYPPVRVTWTGGPAWTRVGDSWVADFGRTIAGWVRLRTDQAAGQEVMITYAEAVDEDGLLRPRSVHVEGDRFQVDSYRGNGELDQQWEPRYSYKGFRYVQLDGLTHLPDARTLTACAAHNDVDRVGVFDCAEPLFVTFADAMARTITNNLHHVPTDTPVYEKNGWTGDAQLGTPTMINFFDLRSLLAKWLDDLRDGMTPEGALPVIAPTAGWGYNQLAPSPEWTTVYPYLVRELYRHYGDRSLLKDHWPAVARYLDWELGKLVDGLPVSELGDYLAPGTQGNGPDDSVLTATAFLIRALRYAVEIADLIGSPDDGARFGTAADELHDRLLQRCLAPERDAIIVGDHYSQTANATALVHGLIPDDAVPAVVARLVGDVEDRGIHHNVGCIGAQTLLKALTWNGHGELALALARQRTYPSWGYWFEQGADTMWEFWEDTTRSRDHYFHGTVVQWLIEDLAGLTCGDHGWRTFRVRPWLLGDVDHASHSIDTVRGRVGVRWSRAGGRVELDVTVPPGSTATVSVPGVELEPPAGVAVEATGEFAVSSGVWRFAGAVGG